MKRILALVEGQTEETFVRDVLALHLKSFGIHVTPVVISTKRVKSGYKFRGGIGNYKQFKRDLKNLLRDRNATAITMMADYYGLPKDFPGMSELNSSHSCYQRAGQLEESLGLDILDRRFVPYLSLHEFEALLLTSPNQVGRAFTSPRVVSKLKSIVDSVGSPEEINDGPNTHPAVRLMKLVPEYRKRLHGPMIAGRIGLDEIRQKCPHFDQWIHRLEGLGSE